MDPDPLDPRLLRLNRKLALTNKRKQAADKSHTPTSARRQRIPLRDISISHQNSLTPNSANCKMAPMKAMGQIFNENCHASPSVMDSIPIMCRSIPTDAIFHDTTAIASSSASYTTHTPPSVGRQRTPMRDTSTYSLDPHRAPMKTVRGFRYAELNDDVLSVDTDTATVAQIPIGYHDIGDPSCICGSCGALMWYEERGIKSKNQKVPTFSLCCMKGQVQLPLLQDPPLLLRNLLSGEDSRSRNFFENIRGYNNMFAFTSMGGKLKIPTDGKGPYCFRLKGQNVHRIGSLLPVQGDTPKFCQLYIYDTENEDTNRIRAASSYGSNEYGDFDSSLVCDLKNMIDDHNPLAKAFRMARDRFGEAAGRNLKLKLIGKRGRDGRRYNLPSTSEVAAIIFDEPGGSTGERDIVIETQTGMLQRITELHPSYLALQYPLLFPYGEDGFTIDIEHRAAEGTSKRQRSKLTIREFFAYRFQLRMIEHSVLLDARKLTQQIVVDSYTILESSRLLYCRLNQQSLRSDTYMNLSNAAGTGNTAPSSAGKRILLPSSYVGGPRYMVQNFQDAMAICKYYGHPDLFITFTCNSKWPELTRLAKKLNVRIEDRFDFTCRLFSIKLHELIQDLRCNNFFGKCQAIVYTIEFQKRGLPHAHIVLFLARADKLSTAEDIDRVICADIPDPATHPTLYQAVKDFMMHGPCGKLNTKSPCMQQGSCSKYFPKGFVDKTTFDDDGYPLYRRTNSGRTVTKGQFELDSRFVVPYNPKLLVKYKAHINVEFCNQSRSIKYLFKYISKGNDRIMATISNDDENEAEVDEIQRFHDARYISPIEALWRIFAFLIHYRVPAVERLNYRLPNQQNLVFADDDPITAVLNHHGAQNSMFLAWMECNKKYEEARVLTYAEFPTEFVWKQQQKEWAPRIRGFAIGRMFNVRPAANELYYLRILLNQVKGATSYEDIRTVNGVVYSTFKEACYSLGLLDDETEYVDAIVEAAFSGHPSYLRRLFAMLLLSGSMSSPEFVWARAWQHLSDDILLRQRRILRMQDLQLSEIQLKNYALAEIEILMQRNGSSLRNYPPMPLPDDILIMEGCNKLIQDELRYDRDKLSQEHIKLISSFTDEQMMIYDEIMVAVSRGKGGVFFVYGYGGTGKTFLWRALSAGLRSKGEIVLTVASSGIAALLIPGGRTAHSRFSIPIDIDENSTCHIKPGTPLAELICKAQLIIWDEAPVAQKFCFEALDRTLRDVLRFSNPHSLYQSFGGKVVVLGGDFRQILPVISRGTRHDIVSATINSSYLWQSCKVLTLTRNMRLQVDYEFPNLQELKDFSQWILNVGEGTVGVHIYGESIIEIPSDLLITYIGDPVAAIVETIYRSLLEHLSDPHYFQDRAILSPTHELVDYVNDHLLSLIPGDEKIYFSSDSICKTDGFMHLGQPLYSIDFLNNIKCSGIPNHVLRLKVGVPIILMRNID